MFPPGPYCSKGSPINQPVTPGGRPGLQLLDYSEGILVEGAPSGSSTTVGRIINSGTLPPELDTRGEGFKA